MTIFSVALTNRDAAGTALRQRGNPQEMGSSCQLQYPGGWCRPPCFWVKIPEVFSSFSQRKRKKKKRSLYLGLPRTGEFINFSFDFLKTYPYDFVQVMGLGLVNLYKVHRSWTGREKLEIQFQKQSVNPRNPLTKLAFVLG